MVLSGRFVLTFSALVCALHCVRAAPRAAGGTKAVDPSLTSARPSDSTAAYSQSVLVGDYSDPNHPGCKRRVDADGTVSGTDGSPGCEHGEKQTPWSLQGKISGDTITVDFSPKGGPAGLVGTWAGDGILWADGNTWTKLSASSSHSRL